MITVNLDTSTARNGPKILIKNGVPTKDYKFRYPSVSFDTLDALYQAYKNSVPADRYDTSQYFYAKPAEQMTTDELMCGQNRRQAKEALELAVLEGIIRKQLIWPNPSLWFWQSANNPDLILLRRWFENPKAGGL